jgi:M-phase inducer tyrosine phosphatase
METSSPLAAMRPTPPSNFGQSNMFGPRLVPSPLDRGQFTFQLRNAEYFNLKAVQGSSPAASLAADLSQNFKLNEARSVHPPGLWPVSRDACCRELYLTQSYK